MADSLFNFKPSLRVSQTICKVNAISETKPVFAPGNRLRQNKKYDNANKGMEY